MRYRLTTKFGGRSEHVEYYKTLNEALEDGRVFMDTWTQPEERVGSLRGDGLVELWLEHRKLGYVILEQRMPDGSYWRIG